MRGADRHGALAVALLKSGKVEGVQRLAGEHHHVVGDVDHIVVRAHTAGVQALDQPIGRGAHLHVAHHARHVAIAQTLVEQLDRDGILGARAGLLAHLRELDGEIAVVDGADLAGDADHGQAVRAVGRDLAVEHHVGAAQILGERHAHRGVLRQDPNALVVGGQAELARGAVHAHRHHAAELALLDLDVAGQHRAHHGGHDMVALVEVLRAAHDLQRLGVALGIDVVGAHVNRADPQMVRIGMGGLGEHLRGDHVVKGLAHGLDRLDLGARADELAGELGRVLRQLNHSGKPVVRNFHLKPLLRAPQFGDSP